MKSRESLEKAYLKQKRIFEESQNEKEMNRKEKIEKLKQKILLLQQEVNQLQSLRKQEFASFEVFIQGIEEQRRLTIMKKEGE